MAEKIIPFECYRVPNWLQKKVLLVEREARSLRKLEEICENSLYHNIYLRSKLGWYAESESFGLVFTAYKGHVVSLVIYNQNLKDIPDFILDFSHLQELYIADTYSTNVEHIMPESIPSTIGKLSELRILRIYNSKLQSLPSSITNLKKLKKLAIVRSDLRALPADLGKLKALKQLNIWSNSLEEIPESIGSCSLLKEINFRFNNLTFIPDSVGSLQSLHKLNLTGNQIREIPASFKNLASLEELYLDSNELKPHSVPEWLFSLKSLKTLHLDENKNNKNKTIIVAPEVLEKAREKFNCVRKYTKERFSVIYLTKKGVEENKKE